MSARVPDAGTTADVRLPRVLAGVRGGEAIGLAEHRGLHGDPLGSGLGPADLSAELHAAGLRGRGGAGFPASVKVDAIAARRRAAVVVVNALEGEPLSAKDRLLLASAPQLVLDGALVLAAALGAAEVVVCIPAGRDELAQVLQTALSERVQAEPMPAPVRLAAVPARYIAGEETALVSHLNDGSGLPTFHPPRPFESGVSRRPTIVHNPETLAHVAMIAARGADWFKQLGTEVDPGSTLVTLRGAVASPGVYEIERATGLATLVDAAGGTTEPTRALLVGGYFGSWIGPAHMPSLTLSDEALSEYGASLGCGVVVLLGESACPVAESSRVMSYLAAESAQQCGPCRYGLRDIARTVEAISRGVAGPGALRDLARWCDVVPGRGACRHPDGAVRFIAGALEVFAEEIADHALNGECEACLQPPVLRVGQARPRSPKVAARA